MSKTLFDKIWDNHLVANIDDYTDLIYVDLHLMHEVTSPHAFNILNSRGKKVKRPNSVIATMDHQIPTKDIYNVKDEVAKAQMDALINNTKEHGINKVYAIGTDGQGIIHGIAPQSGAIKPGMTVVCGDSHTSTHGAFGAIAFGIGISEIAHVLETQCIMQNKPKNMLVQIDGKLNEYVTAKDIILHILSVLGTDGGVGYAIEYSGSTIKNLSMDERMTICNMTIELGSKYGLIAPDNTTFEYLKGREFSTKGNAFEESIEQWSNLCSDKNVKYDKTIFINAQDIKENVTWGTTPAQVINIDGNVPNPKNSNEEKALEYMGLKPGQYIKDITVDAVFIGSCTNGRLDDIRTVANIVKGHRVNPNIKAIVVPATMQIKKQAEEEGIDKILLDAGFEWRFAGCSTCIGMNDDTLDEYNRCASTSNRNFEGRQGKNVRTHLVSPSIAAATAILGHFASPSDIKE